MNVFKRIKDWWTFRGLEIDFNKEVDENVNMWSNSDPVSEVQEDQEIQQKYYNGITLMKRRLREMGGSSVMDRFKGSKDFYIGSDLLSLAQDSSRERQRTAELKKSIYAYEGADVKTEDDKVKMVNKRIGDYRTLQDKTEERELSRKIRAAYKDGNEALHASLLKEWESRYGKHRNAKTRY